MLVDLLTGLMKKRVEKEGKRYFGQLYLGDYFRIAAFPEDVFQKISEKFIAGASCGNCINTTLRTLRTVSPKWRVIETTKPLHPRAYFNEEQGKVVYHYYGPDKV